MSRTQSFWRGIMYAVLAIISLTTSHTKIEEGDNRFWLIAVLGILFAIMAVSDMKDASE